MSQFFQESMHISAMPGRQVSQTTTLCSMTTRPVRWFILLASTILFLVLPGTLTCSAASKPFPLYYAIVDNVNFWEKIYSTYSLNQAVIHDSDDLSKVYGVISLVDDKTPGASKINSQRQQQAIENYSRMLTRLAGGSPVTGEEKRIAALFTGPNRLQELRNAAKNVRSQRGQKERFLEGVVKSGAFLEEIRAIFRSYNLPEDLAYLPHVESSFNTRAYSKFGAAGMWQFTRSTGKLYMMINSEVDERLDPILATHAAAKYLRNSYEKLGTWPLAITSYNYGLAGMLRAREDKGSYSEIYRNYQKGYFKFASKNFYSEFLAARMVAEKLEKKYRLHRPQRVTTFKLRGFVHINQLTDHFRTTVATLQRLNPALRAPVFGGEKLVPEGYTLRLPNEQSTAKLINSFPSSRFKSSQNQNLFHRVKKGETAGAIARQYDISLSDLLSANNLDRFSTIYIRQKLRIPLSHGGIGFVPVSPVAVLNAKPKIVALSPQGGAPPVLTAAKKNKPTSWQSTDFLPSKDPTIYNVFNITTRGDFKVGQVVVQPEESLELFAQWLNTDIATLTRMSNLPRGRQISPGQKIQLFFNHVSPDKFEEKRLDFLNETEEDFFSAYTVIGKTMYTVEPGDTLWDLCYNKFDIPLWLLERYNSTINLAQLRHSQELIIPLVQQL